MRRRLPLALCAAAALAGCHSLSDWSEVAGPAPPDASDLAWGTGLFVTDSVVLTAKHVVRDCAAIRIAAANGTLLGAEAGVLARANVDLALVALDRPATGVRPAAFRELWPDAAAMASVGPGLSYPLTAAGPFLGAGYTTAAQALAPEVQTMRGLLAERPERAAGLHRYTVLGAIRHGDSGGPLLDRNGAVIGIMTTTANMDRIAQQSPWVNDVADLQEGFGVAIATNDVLPFLALAHVAPSAGAPEPGRAITQSLARVFCYR